MSVPLGQPVTLTFLTYSDAAQTTLADATTVSVDILDPAGVTTTYTLAGAQVVHAATGTYTLAYTPSTAGHYAYQWTSTGTVTTASYGSIDVEPKYGAWLSLADAKAHLNITTTTNDVELQAVIDAAVEIVEDYAGAVATTTATDAFVTDTATTWPFHYGTWPRYAYYAVRTVDLRTTPVQSVQAVVVSSMDGTNPTTLASTSYRVDTVHGNVTVIDGSAFGPLVTVTYTAGRTSVPPSLRLAALKLVKHLWADQRGGGAGRSVPGSAGDEYQAPVTAHLVPWEVEELLERYRRPATVA